MGNECDAAVLIGLTWGMLRKSTNQEQEMRGIRAREFAYIPSQMKENGNDAAHSSQVASAVPKIPVVLLILDAAR